jgi:hypothetical protein
MIRERARILFFQEPWGGIHRSSCDCCDVTLDRDQWENADAIVFHIPQVTRFPPGKSKDQVWVALSVESSVHYPILARRHELGGLFDLWMTYRRDADVWCPYFNPNALAELQSDPSEKTQSSPAAAFISSKVDRSGRIALLEALMRHMSVDSYGKVCQNRVLPDDDGFETKCRVLARYRFTLAFENAIDEDYVTEKFYDPLLAGSVPVYLGAPNVDEFAPGDDCYINAANYDSPSALADHLLDLAADATAYGRYLRWKSQPLRRSFLEMVDNIRVPPLCRLSRLLRECRYAPARPMPMAGSC